MHTHFLVSFKQPCIIRSPSDLNNNSVLNVDQWTSNIWCQDACKELVEKTRELGFNLSRTFENHLKTLITQLRNVYSKNNCEKCMFGSPGEIRTPVSGSRARNAWPLHSAERIFFPPPGYPGWLEKRFTFLINSSPQFLLEQMSCMPNWSGVCSEKSLNLRMHCPSELTHQNRKSQDLYIETFTQH